ncbi:unnamed protein product [Mycena citricolor]|uniref:Uncharacterized protein n=2 Tax=Mycena citricolor TaxID=2018698 RepID=A0AAD2HYC2_9AGAR|nr:unnamed protein product [Mycena citricolor]
MEFLDTSARDDDGDADENELDMDSIMAEFIDEGALYGMQVGSEQGDLDNEMDGVLSAEEANQHGFEERALLATSLEHLAHQPRMELPDDEAQMDGLFALSQALVVQSPPIVRIPVPRWIEEDLVLWLIRHCERMPDVVAAYTNPLVPDFVYVETTDAGRLFSAFKNSPSASALSSFSSTASKLPFAHGIVSYPRFRSISRSVPVILDSVWDVKASLSIRAQRCGWARVTGVGAEAFRLSQHAVLYRGDLVFVCDADTLLVIPRINFKRNRACRGQRPPPSPFLSRNLLEGSKWEQIGQHVRWGKHYFLGPFEEIQCKVFHHPRPVAFLSEPPPWDELRPFVDLDSLRDDRTPAAAGKERHLILDSPFLAQAYENTTRYALQAGDRAILDTYESLEYDTGRGASDVFIRGIDYAHNKAVITKGYTDTGDPSTHLRLAPSSECSLKDLRLHPLSPPRNIKEGDRVIVVRSTAQAREGLVGRVCATEGEILHIVTVHEDPPQLLHVSIGNVCIHYVSADVVRIMYGRHAEMEGVVLNAEEDGHLSLQLTTLEAIFNFIQERDYSNAQLLGSLEPLLIPIFVPRWQVQLVTLGTLPVQESASFSQTERIEMLSQEEKIKLKTEFTNDVLKLRKFEVLIVAGPLKGKRGRIVDYKHTSSVPSTLDLRPDVGMAARWAEVSQRDPLEDVELTVGLDGTMKNETMKVDDVRELRSGFRLRQALHFRNISNLPLFSRPRTPSPPPDAPVPLCNSKSQVNLASQEDGSWLCLKSLLGKRVDVMIDDAASLRLLQLKREKGYEASEKTKREKVKGPSSRKSKAPRSRVLDALSAQLYERGAGQPAFVVGRNIPDAETAAVHAHIWPSMQVMKVPVSALKPCRKTLPPVGGGSPQSILDIKARVVIIGPDVHHSTEFMGEYGETIPDTRIGVTIKVRFEWRRDPGASEADQPVARFDLFSICSSTNIVRIQRGTNLPLYKTSTFDQ